jgi:hypothetical protein
VRNMGANSAANRNAKIAKDAKTQNLNFAFLVLAVKFPLPYLSLFLSMFRSVVDD